MKSVLKFSVSRFAAILMLPMLAAGSLQAQEYVQPFTAQQQFDTQFETVTQKYPFENFKGSPKAEQIDCEDLGYATRERWQIWTEPTLVIPFMIVRPKGELKNVPLCITSQGHDDNPELYAGIDRDFSDLSDLS